MAKNYAESFMQTKPMASVVYTADDEEPDCGQCDNICGTDEFCTKCCGAEHYWNGYSRTVLGKED